MNIDPRNLLLNTDSYKASHWLQYPPGTENVSSYIEARFRACFQKYKFVVPFGLQYALKEYLTKPITQQMIDEAVMFWAAHGEPFNKEGWEYILHEHGGYIPIIIHAVPEGKVVPIATPLVVVEATDEKCGWVVSYFETMLIRALWYGSTVATQSWYLKQLIKKYLEKTGDPAGISFKLHDFGARGVSSFESAGIGGAAHLVNFMGTDTVTGALFAMKYYNQTDMPAFSIPAAEHSTITSWGRQNESKAYANMIKMYGKPGALVAVVSDSYNIYNAVNNIWGEELRQQVIDSGAILVIRPDSGHPATVVTEVLRSLERSFGSVVNAKGYMVLNHVRVIQGDGINPESIKEILDWATSAGFSADNIAFGMGGALLQGINRDTLSFAMKCSAIKINGEWVDVFKDPVDDVEKRSKAGRQITADMETVFENGKLIKDYTFAEIRARADAELSVVKELITT